MLFDNVLIGYIIERGLPGDGATVTEIQQLRSELATYQARPVVSTLDTLTDVDIAGAEVADVLALAADGDWKPAPAPRSVAITRLGNNVDHGDMIHNINTVLGLTVSTDVQTWGNRANIGVDFGGTGVSVQAARSDHTHNLPVCVNDGYVPSGYMSGGKRTVKTVSVTLQNNVPYIVKAILSPQIRGADAGAAYYQMILTINGNSRTSPGGTNGPWAVQGVPAHKTWAHAVAITGTGGAIIVTAEIQYFGGAGFYVDAGDLEVVAMPAR